MSGLAISAISLGAMVIVLRGALVVAPEATMEFFGRAIERNAGIRVIGLIALAWGAVLIFLAADTPGTPARVLEVLGTVLGAAGLFLQLFPGSYRELAKPALGFTSGATRGIGVVGVAFGVGIVWLGFAVG